MHLMDIIITILDNTNKEEKMRKEPRLFSVALFR